MVDKLWISKRSDRYGRKTEIFIGTDEKTAASRSGWGSDGFPEDMVVERLTSIDQLITAIHWAGNGKAED